MRLSVNEVKDFFGTVPTNKFTAFGLGRGGPRIFRENSEKAIDAIDGLGSDRATRDILVDQLDAGGAPLRLFGSTTTFFGEDTLQALNKATGFVTQIGPKLESPRSLLRLSPFDRNFGTAALGLRLGTKIGATASDSLFFDSFNPDFDSIPPLQIGPISSGFFDDTSSGLDSSLGVDLPPLQLNPPGSGFDFGGGQSASFISRNRFINRTSLSVLGRSEFTGSSGIPQPVDRIRQLFR